MIRDELIETIKKGVRRFYPDGPPIMDNVAQEVATAALTAIEAAGMHEVRSDNPLGRDAASTIDLKERLKDNESKTCCGDRMEALARITELEDALRVLLEENGGRYATKEAWDRARKVLGSTGGQHQ